MPCFKCLLLRKSGEVAGFETLEVANSADALAKIEPMLGQQGMASIEVWHKGRLAIRLTLNDLASSPFRIDRFGRGNINRSS